MAYAFYTVGHSTRTVVQFVDLLGVGGVKQVVDVRAMPRSRANPQFNAGVLPETLSPSGIAYTHIAELAGLRRASKTIADEVNGYWRNRSFHNYADYALSPQFHRGLDRLIELGTVKPCAVMCSEAVWWRCHRRIIADYLLIRGETVYHLMDRDRAQPAALTEAARATGTGKLVYPTHNTAAP
jgi:uncharacterized protein (DUF488 family)